MLGQIIRKLAPKEAVLVLLERQLKTGVPAVSTPLVGGKLVAQEDGVAIRVQQERHLVVVVPQDLPRSGVMAEMLRPVLVLVVQTRKVPREVLARAVSTREPAVLDAAARNGQL